MSASLDTQQTIRSLSEEGYKYGFVTDIEADSAPPGLNEDTVRFISAKKGEPEWLLEWRLAAFRAWREMPEPDWAKVEELVGIQLNKALQAGAGGGAALDVAAGQIKDYLTQAGYYK